MTIEEITEQLTAFLEDPKMHTESIYSPTAVDFPDNRLPFVDYHLMYIKSHKNVNPEYYISNLRLMITKR